MKKHIFNIISFLLLISFLLTIELPVSAEDVIEKPQINDYTSTLTDNANSISAKSVVDIKIQNYTAQNMNVSIEENFKGRIGCSLLTGEEGSISWNFDVVEEGLYCIEIDYFPISGKGSTIERELYIDDEIPFKEFKNILFHRFWKNDEKSIKKDDRGNDLAAHQLEAPVWTKQYVQDYLGYFNDPYKVYLSKGKHKFTMKSVKEPMAIGSISFKNPAKTINYSDYRKANSNKPVIDDNIIRIQAEDATSKTSPTMIAVNDRSPLTMPYNVSKIILNSFGGTRWQMPGDAATWDFNVDKSGLYKISLKYKQNSSKTIVPVRKVYIDGNIPFSELKDVKFPYNRQWEFKTLGDNNEDYLFYLEKGAHTLKMESTLGDYSDYFRQIEESVYVLNECYRNIIMITGVNPDEFRDYRLALKIPQVIKTVKEQSDILSKIMDEIKKKNNANGTEFVTIETLRDQLNDFSIDPESIKMRLESFKINIASLSSWLINIKNQPVLFDYFMITGNKSNLDRASANLIENFRHEFSSFFYSFFEDYSTIGKSMTGGKSISVWIGTGRDQANIINSLINNDFTPNKNINVDLKLVPNTTLINAMIAGKAPDVCLGLSNAEPVNYAIRNSIENLAGFDDYNEIEKRFNESALTPFRFNNGTFALPETQTFPMMFYRTDVFEQLKLKPPATWDEMLLLIRDLGNVNMEIGISCANAAAVQSTMAMFLYQSGGKYYKDSDRASDLDSEISLNSFRLLTDLYTSYKLPYVFDAANRFRTGEMPIVIADYSLFNTLSVSAPEIAGLWSFSTVPGTVQKDSSISHIVSSVSTGCIITKQAKNKNASWEFLKWWTDVETQVQFGREMESLMGAAARYPTANKEALSKLPWRTTDYKILASQLNDTVGIPEVPGGYFTPRHLDNAFRRVINSGDDSRETLLDYVLIINKEIALKRKEFGLK